LIDLKRTEEEMRVLEESRREETAFWKTEEKAERDRLREIARIPEDSGVYFVDGEEIRRLPHADLDVLGNKKKEILKVISPIPIIAGEKTVIIRGKHAEMVVPSRLPEFYIRLFREERFAIIRLTTKKEFRQVEKWEIAPVTDEVFEEREDLGIFRREVGENLYKIWPKEPLEPGEYAVVEFSLGEANIQAWDFSYWPTGAPPKNRRRALWAIKGSDARPPSRRTEVSAWRILPSGTTERAPGHAFPVPRGETGWKAAGPAGR
jgi:hypothetical protein